MDPLVTATDVDNLYGVTGDRIGALCTVVSARVRARCGWTISREEAASWVIEGTDATALLVPTMRLNAVASITTNDEPIDPALYRPSPEGVIVKATPWSGQYTIVADHGYADLPADLVDVAARMVIAAGQAPELVLEDLAEETLDDHTVKRWAPSQMLDALTGDIDQVLDQYTIGQRP